MPSQYEKRKMKEKEDNTKEEVVNKRNKKREQKNIKKDLTFTAYDVTLIDGKHNLVVIKYNPDTKLAEVDVVAPVNKAIGMPFQHKKQALETLTRDLYKLIK